MDGQLRAMVGVTPPARNGGQHHRKSGRGSIRLRADGDHHGETVRTMNAIVNGARSKSTILTAAAGALLLVTAVVMMVCAAPRIHAARPGSVVHDQLSSWVWVTRGHPAQVTPGTAGDLVPGTRTPVP
jgi:hypothetical protein